MVFTAVSLRASLILICFLNPVLLGDLGWQPLEFIGLEHWLAEDSEDHEQDGVEQLDQNAHLEALHGVRHHE